MSTKKTSGKGSGASKKGLRKKTASKPPARAKKPSTPSGEKRMAKEQLIEELLKLKRKVALLEQTKEKLRKHEVLLQESEARFKRLYERAPLGYQSLDEEGYFREVNDAWLKTMGYRREEVIGKWFGDFLPDELKDAFRSNFSKFKSSGAVSGVEFEMIRADGSLISTSFDGKIGRDADGNFMQTHCILQDITQLKAVLGKLQLWSDAVNNAEIGIVVSSADGTRHLTVNPAYARMHGYTVDEFTAMPIVDIFAPEARAALAGHIARVNETGHHSFESLHVRKDGTVFPVSIDATAVKDERGNFKYRVVNVRDITGIKEMERRYQLMFHEMQSGFALHEIICDETGKPVDYRFLALNPAFEKQTGVNASHFIGKTVKELLPGIEDAWIEKYGTVALSGKSIDFENYAEDLGKHFHVVAFSPERGKFACIFHDITRRRQAEELLRENALKTKKYLDTAGVMLCSLDRNGVVTMINPKGAEILGYEQSEIIGKNWFDNYLPERFRKTVWGVFHQLMQGNVKPVAYYENVVLAKGNVEKLIAFHNTNMMDNEGNIIGNLFSGDDITERRAMENELRLSEAFLKKSQEIGHIGSWHLDIEKNILSWSDEEYRIFGHTPQSFGATYEAFLEAVHPDDREMVNRAYTDAITNRTPYECIHRVLRPDGGIRTVLERSEDIVDDSGRTIHSYGMTLDITELRENELRIARTLREKEVLLKEVHHRVKNNMAVISSLLALQARYVDEKKYLAMFNESQSRIRSMALVHEKLYQSDDFAHIDVRDYIASLIDNVGITFGGTRNISKNIRIDDVSLDIDILIPCGLMLNEILTNAFKYAYDGSEKFGISVLMKKTEDGRVTLTIEDNGKGFPEGFDIASSAGLGLKLVKVLISQIDGTLDVQSSPQGVRFTLVFPAEIAHSNRTDAS